MSSDGAAAHPSPLGGDPNSFGTDAFYAAIGRAFVTMCAVVPVLFLIELIDTLTGSWLDHNAGIEPRHLRGLDGVLFAPFLHASFAHVTANSVPLILLGTFVLAAGTRWFLLATAVIALVSGVGTWLFGSSNTVVVGASGVILGYLGALLTRGIVERTWWNVAVGLLIALLYGWQVVTLVPTAKQVSWQAHLFGFLGGVLAAVLLRTRPLRPLRPWHRQSEGDSAGTSADPHHTVVLPTSQDTVLLPPESS